MADESEDIITLAEVIQVEEEEEAQIRAVLGQADTEECSYEQGYHRQPLYSCKTCFSKTGKIAGVCLGCSIHCHDDHELVELYTKRNFRCDCGNLKFESTFECRLLPAKDNTNEKNVYSQNFQGVYCTCNKPYPDPNWKEEEGDECLMCEDWFHIAHISRQEPQDLIDEFACEACVARHPFLRKFPSIVHSVLNKSNAAQICLDDENHKEDSELKVLYFPEAWRSQICQCTTCADFYKRENVDFLLDESDSTSAYEAKSALISTEPSNMLNSLPVNQQYTLARGFLDMKEELLLQISDAVEQNRVITKEDIEQVFSNLKKRKPEEVFLPTNCKKGAF